MTLKRDFASKWKLFQVASLSCKKGFHFEMKTASKIVFAPKTVVYKKIISQMSFKLALENYGAWKCV